MIKRVLPWHGQIGFSLVEIAVVLLIIAILATAVGIPLAAQLDQQRTVDTQKQLANISEALYGFAMTNGRLPCPAKDGDQLESYSPTPVGAEAFASGGSASNGSCATFSGWLPAVTLGLAPTDSSGFALDGWGRRQNRIRYAVRGLTILINTSCATATSNPLTSTDGIKAATMNCLGDATSIPLNPLLSVVSTTVTNIAAGCSPTTLTSKAPFVVFALGKNAATGGTGADEARNINSTTTTFVSHTPTSAGSCSGEFDDIVTWGSLNTLFARMVQAGKLP